MNTVENPYPTYLYALTSLLASSNLWTHSISLLAMAPSEDRINNLSDEIICHILSFVPTKHAVTTGVLSKRWINLWRSIPLLDFSDIKLKGRDLSPIQSVCLLVLVSRDIASNHSIKSFVLNIDYANNNHIKSHSIPNLTTWVNLVVQLKVKYFHLLIHLGVDIYDLHLAVKHMLQAPKLPNSIFSCKTLVVLNLRWWTGIFVASWWVSFSWGF